MQSLQFDVRFFLLHNHRHCHRRHRRHRRHPRPNRRRNGQFVTYSRLPHRRCRDRHPHRLLLLRRHHGHRRRD